MILGFILSGLLFVTAFILLWVIFRGGDIDKEE
jgi:hypothetical protein